MTNVFALNPERWLSGRKREFAKFVTGLTGPQVRILSSPLGVLAP